MYRRSSQLDVASSTEVMRVSEPDAADWTNGERIGGMGVGMEKGGVELVHWENCFLKVKRTSSRTTQQASIGVRPCTVT